MYGTPYYIAPEVLTGKYTEKCDIWSIGVILYVMLCGKAPFNGRNDREILKKVALATYSFTGEIWSRRSEEVKNFIRKLLEKDTSKRLSAANALKDPWLNNKIPETFDLDAAKETLSNLKSFRVSKITKLKY